MTNWIKPLLFLIFIFSITPELIYAQSRPTISFTFDDGSLAHRPGYRFEDWNGMLLQKLDKANITAALFVTGNRKDTDRGHYLLKTWDNNGHLIANHTWNHPNYNDPKMTITGFKQEILRTDSLINSYINYKKLFRFPYLKEGNSPEKVTAMRQFLDSLGYGIGYVTIDASDWYIDSRLIQKLKQDSNTDLAPYRDFYLAHIWERAQFYENLSYQINGRHIKHNLLLHHNLLSALFIDDLIDMFKQKGWMVISTKEAFTDPIYSSKPNYAGESLIYALAKDSGKYDRLLRYPAEDFTYEKEKMDKLGL